jgi:hypothetical protein
MGGCKLDCSPFFISAAFVGSTISFSLDSASQKYAPCIDSRIVSDDAVVLCPAISFIFSYVGNDAMKIDEIKAMIPIMRPAVRFLPLFLCQEAGV